MTATTVGREPVQIVEIRQPLCANVYGTSPCTASGGADAKCFNTRATCQDAENYRARPAGHLSADQELASGDAVAVGAGARAADLFFSIKARFPSDAEGVLWEQGSSTGNCLYLGINASGNLIFRAGDGTSLNPTNAAKISTSASVVRGKTLVLFGSVDVSANSVTLWAWDERLREVTEIDTDTAAGSFTTWAGAGGGAVGVTSGTAATGENTAAFTGTIDYLRIYESTSAPDMTASFVRPLYFSRGNVADNTVPGLPYVIPSLVSVSTAPTEINLSSANPDASGLGMRALVSIQFKDHPHTDRLVDPYLSGRTYSPMQRGSFWSKWLVRNLYRTNIMIRVYEGYAGQALSAMTERRYFLTEVSGPDSNGNVSVKGKDILARLEERKATAPLLSPGELYSDTSAGSTSIVVANAVLGEYPETGTLRIDDELMTYTSVATSTNGLTFSGLTRGTDGTMAADHSAEALVQECLRYTDEPVADICRDLLGRWGGIDEGWLDYENWVAEAEQYLPQYDLSTVISEPVGVSELVSELQEQAAFYMWWDERDALVKFKAIRGLDSEPDTLTDAANIMPGFTVKDLPRMRVSQVWFYYAARDYAGSMSDPDNFEYATVDADLEAETEEQYGEQSIRKIYSRWITTAALANTTASKIRNRYRETPRQASFQMDAKDGSYWVGDTVGISHRLDVDAFGNRRIRYWTIISAEEVMPGEVVAYTVEDTTLYGSIYYIQAGGSPDYPPSNSFGAAYIGNAAGLLSDGTTCARIS